MGLVGVGYFGWCVREGGIRLAWGVVATCGGVVAGHERPSPLQTWRPHSKGASGQREGNGRRHRPKQSARLRSGPPPTPPIHQERPGFCTSWSFNRILKDLQEAVLRPERIRHPLCRLRVILPLPVDKKSVLVLA